jgi:hypothetical protein
MLARDDRSTGGGRIQPWVVGCLPQDLGRKVLFFEKKKQISFAPWHTRFNSKCAVQANEQKFFWFFF